MKTFKTMLFVFTVSFATLSWGQEAKETIKKELQFNTQGNENILHVQNVNGSISVEGYAGSKILVEVEKRITAKRQEFVELGTEEIDISVQNKGNHIYLYLESPWTYFDLEKGRFSHHEQYNRNEQPKYRYRLDFKVKVPMNTGVNLGTMNQGDIYVKNVQGSLMKVHNLNGAIDLVNIAGQTDVNALNKDINISYHSNPTEDCYFNSLNGDITVVFKEDLNADISFKSMNGDLFTNYETTALKPQVTQKRVNGSKGTKFKLNSKQAVRIGKGGIKLDFDLLNGDALVKR